MGCEQVLCGECAAAGRRNTCPFVHCFQCRTFSANAARRPSQDPELESQRGALVAATIQGVALLEQARYADATYKRHARNLKDYMNYCYIFGYSPFPASRVVLEQYIPYSLALREPTLDPSSVELILGAISGWHIQAQLAYATAPTPVHIENHAKSPQIQDLLKTIISKFKNPVRAKLLLSSHSLITVLAYGFNTSHRFGRQQQAFTVLSMAAPLRPGAVSLLRITYHISGGNVVTHPDSDIHFYPNGDARWPHKYIHLNVKYDKNITPSCPRDHYLPERVAGWPVYDTLHSYVVEQRPPSGGYMLVAPSSAQGQGFYSTPYSNFASAFKQATSRALPELDYRDHSGGTPRKSMAQWLNIAGVPERQLADICGWSIPDRAAMVGYLHTTPQMHMDYKLLIPAVEL